jgi:hypothetical protein
MPLHTDKPPLSPFYRFRYAVRCHSRSHHAISDTSHRLMMIAVDRYPLTKQPLQTTAFRKPYGMPRRPARTRLLMTYRIRPRTDILIQIAAKRNIHHLHPTADAEYRPTAFHSHSTQRHLPYITHAIDASDAAMRLFPEEQRTDITATA